MRNQKLPLRMIQKDSQLGRTKTRTQKLVPRRIQTDSQLGQSLKDNQLEQSRKDTQERRMARRQRSSLGMAQ